ncbi:MAG: hypothetical protein WC849_01230 [Candidatus Paceibacterota bacterium]
MNRKRKLFMTLGIIIALIPLFSIPVGFKYFFIIILSLWIVGSAFLSDRTLSDFVAKKIGIRIHKKKLTIKKAESLLFREDKNEEKKEEVEQP